MDQPIKPSNNSKEDQWIIRIRNNLAQALDRDDVEEQGEKTDVITIFGVPKLLLAGKPEAYVPQHVGIGPYHQDSPHLKDMEKYKLEAATKLQHKLVDDLRFEDVVAHLVKLEGRVRACYHRYLDISDENLAWIIAIDASFLLEYLQGLIGADSGDTLFGAASSFVSRALDHFVMRDIILLENQIPLFVVKDILSFQSHENREEVLEAMLVVLCTVLCPFKRGGKVVSVIGNTRSHLLEVLYFVTLPHEDHFTNYSTEDGSLSSEETNGITNIDQQLEIDNHKPPKFHIFPILYRKLLSHISRQLAVVIRLVALMSNIAKRRTQPTNPETSLHKLPTKGSMPSTTAGPTTEELLVPRITDLNNVGVKFASVAGDISDLKFDPTSATLYLPTITLDHNSDVVLRNMVAYEAVAANGPLVLARYVELMNGMIDTEEDVRLLRVGGVVVSHMKSDGEVAGLWNGMGRSLRLTKVEGLDMVIADLNRFYGESWRTRVRRVVKYVYGWWPLLTLLAANLIILMSTLQAFCTVYDCKGSND